MRQSKRVPSVIQIRGQFKKLPGGDEKKRSIDSRDLRLALEQYRKFVRFCKKHGLAHPSLYLDGGAVSNSYKYAAWTSTVRITRKDEGEYLVEVARDYARRIPHGDYGILRLSAEKSTGIRWADLPEFQGKKFNSHGNINVSL